SDPSAFRLVNAPFTNEKYGIGIAKEDVAGCEEVNRAGTRMYQDGTAEELLDEWFGETGLDLVTSVPQFEGCGCPGSLPAGARPSPPSGTPSIRRRGIRGVRGGGSEYPG